MGSRCLQQLNENKETRLDARGRRVCKSRKLLGGSEVRVNSTLAHPTGSPFLLLRPDRSVRVKFFISGRPPGGEPPPRKSCRHVDSTPVFSPDGSSFALSSEIRGMTGGTHRSRVRRKRNGDRRSGPVDFQGASAVSLGPKRRPNCCHREKRAAFRSIPGSESPPT